MKAYLLSIRRESPLPRSDPWFMLSAYSNLKLAHNQLFELLILKYRFPFRSYDSLSRNFKRGRPEVFRAQRVSDNLACRIVLRSLEHAGPTPLRKGQKLWLSYFLPHDGEGGFMFDNTQWSGTHTSLSGLCRNFESLERTKVHKTVKREQFFSTEELGGLRMVTPLELNLTNLNQTRERKI